MAPNPPSPNSPTTPGGVSISGSYYDGIGGGATLVVTSQGAWLIPEFGLGFGPSVAVNAGSNVNVPNAPSLQFSGSLTPEQIGPVGVRGSLSATFPLNTIGDPNTWNVGGNLGFNLPGLPAGNLRLSDNYSNTSGLTGGLQNSLTSTLFENTEQLKLAVRVPIPLGTGTVTTRRTRTASMT